MGKGGELVEALRRRARVESVAGELEAFTQVGGVAAGCDRARRVEQDCRAAAAGGTREDLADRHGVLGGGAAAKLLRVAALDAELERVDLASCHRAVDNLADEIR